MEEVSFVFGALTEYIALPYTLRCLSSLVNRSMPHTPLIRFRFDFTDELRSF